MAILPLLFWYCYDDHLASIFGVDIGHVPVLAWFLLVLFSASTEGLRIFAVSKLRSFSFKMPKKVSAAPREKKEKPPQVVVDNSVEQDAVAALAVLNIKGPVAAPAVRRALAGFANTPSVTDLVKASLQQLDRNVA